LRARSPYWWISGPRGAARAACSAPVIDEIAADRTDIVVAKVNVDDAPDIAQRYGIQGIPFIGLFEGGQLTKNAVGAMPRAGIEQALGLS